MPAFALDRVEKNCLPIHQKHAFPICRTTSTKKSKGKIWNNKSTMKIAIDGGHRTSRSLSIDHEKNESEIFVLSEPINLRTDKSAFVNRFLKHIEHHTQGNSIGAKKSEVNVVISLPGCTFTWQSQKYEPTFEKIKRRCKSNGIILRTLKAIDDTWAALLTETNELNGISVICGHGSTVAYIPNSQPFSTIKFDGLGPILGDNSSGYYLSLSILRYLCLNRNDPECSKLLDDIVSEMSSDEFLSTCFPEKLREDPVHWIHMLQTNKPDQLVSTIASLATSIFNITSRSNSKLSCIQKTEGEMVGNVTGQISKAIALAEFNGTSKTIVLQGGLIRSNSQFAESITQQILKTTKDCHVIVSARKIVHGTLNYAKLFDKG